MLIMKRKIKNICWILFTAGSMICLFYNFMSKPPVNDPKALTIYIICAAGAAIIYPAVMGFLAFRNRSLHERLQKKSEVPASMRKPEASSQNLSGKYSYTADPEVRRLISALSDEDHLSDEEKELLLEYIKKK